MMVRQAEVMLLPLRSNIAWLRDAGLLSSEQARDYAREWMLDSDDQVERSIDSLEARSWPA
jgi:hypothetical protein